MIALDLPAEIETELAEAAAREGRSPQDIARELILEFLEEQEDIRIVTERLKHPGRAYTLEEVEAMYRHELDRAGD
jgi:predicted DNA-binding protein